MVWQSVWESSLVLLQRLAALLRDVSDGAAAAFNSSQPVISDALQRAADLLHSYQPAPLQWPDLGLPEIEIDSFQANLLLAITGILVTNVLLVYLAWSRYGERIVEHFTSADSTATHKLRDFGARQNFPKEFSPKL